MRFDLLLATSNSGLYAALALMIGGFVLAVGGLAALLWRRKKLSKPAPSPTVVDQEAPDTPTAEVVDAPASTPAPAVPEGRRRRSLVGGAERDNGTPAGVSVSADDAADEEPDGQEPLDDYDQVEDAVEGEQGDSDGASEAEFSEIEPEFEEATQPETAEASVAGAAIEDLEDPQDPVEEHAEHTEPDTSVPAEIALARANPIVFRQFIPQSPAEDGLSFYGGQPIGPADFEWPRQGGVPLTFMMQWDCMQLSTQDVSGLLPDDGVLYCFINLNWGGEGGSEHAHAFVHHSGPTDDWSPVTLPSDAPPVFGSQGPWGVTGCTPEVENAENYVPRLMPRFPFEPIAFEYPMAGPDQDAGADRFWSDAEQTAEALLAVQQVGKVAVGDISDIETPHQPFARPFEAFPHDFGAIRVLAAAMLDALQRPPKYKLDRVFPDHSKEELDTLFETWKGEARELYLLGTQRPLGHPVEQQIADDIWQWVEARKDMIDLMFNGKTVPQSIELSLGVGSEALGAIPADLIENAMSNHVVAREYMTNEDFDPDKHGSREDYLKLSEEGKLDRVRKVSAGTPARIFGPPSFVQGYVDELIDDHVLLLELHGGAEPGHDFGEGVLQYLITPQDLAAGRFDQVKSVISAY